MRSLRAPAASAAPHAPTTCGRQVASLRLGKHVSPAAAATAHDRRNHAPAHPAGVQRAKQILRGPMRWSAGWLPRRAGTGKTRRPPSGQSSGALWQPNCPRRLDSRPADARPPWPGYFALIKSWRVARTLDKRLKVVSMSAARPSRRKLGPAAGARAPGSQSSDTIVAWHRRRRRRRRSNPLTPPRPDFSIKIENFVTRNLGQTAPGSLA